MRYVCVVCRRDVHPDPRGKILVVGVTFRSDPERWVWGPEACHRVCQSLVRTPYEDQVRDGSYVRAWQWITA